MTTSDFEAAKKNIRNWLIELTRGPETLPLLRIDEGILFIDHEIPDFIEKVRKKYLEMDCLYKIITKECDRNRNGQKLAYTKKKYNTFAEREHELIGWLRSQPNELERLFEKHLGLFYGC